MATTPSEAEIQRRIAYINECRKRVANNPEEARRLLQAAGIFDKDGKLAPPYRS
jgi:hypothetical protein